jgi:hypothetical protein
MEYKMKNKTFMNAYIKDIVCEANARNVYGLCDFNFPKYVFRNVDIGDKLIHVWTSNRGESGNWGIQYWTVSAEEVEVIKINEDSFEVTGGKVVPLKKTASKIDTVEKTEVIIDPAVDRYDTGAWTEHARSTRKVKESYGDGVYPASFLLKYYNNTEKGYSLIGGGGSYSGPDFDTLKQIAQEEKSVKRMLAKSAKATEESYEPQEKDVQRILDMIEKAGGLTFFNFYAFNMLDYVSKSSYRDEDFYDGMLRFYQWYAFTFPERISEWQRRKYYLPTSAPSRRTITKRIKCTVSF